MTVYKQCDMVHVWRGLHTPVHEGVHQLEYIGAFIPCIAQFSIPVLFIEAMIGCFSVRVLQHIKPPATMTIKNSK